MNPLRNILHFYGKSRTHLGGKVRPFFAKMIAPYDVFDPAKHDALLRALEQTEEDLECVYCGQPGKTIDHLRSTIQDQTPTGYGHTYGNILPCCHSCNSRKRTAPWEQFANAEARSKIERMINDLPPRKSELDVEWPALLQIREQILELLNEADIISERIHTRRLSNDA